MNKEELLKQAIVKARTNFYTYVQLMAPFVLPEDFVDGPHIKVMADRLTLAEDQVKQRLMFELPPGSMKSTIISQLYPSWLFGRQPRRQILHISHTATLVDLFGRQIRNLVKTDYYNLIFPGAQISTDSRASDRWHTTEGGVYASFGVGSPIAGFRGRPIIIDDAMSEQTAVSKIERQKIISWYPKGLRTRVVPDSNIIVVGTRWTQDDLQGYLIKKGEQNDSDADRFERIKIPAILDEEGSKLLGLPVGGSYWPQRWPLEVLEAIKKNLPPSDWSALYMQDPLAEGGNIFKTSQIKNWDFENPPECEYVVVSADTAYSTRQSADNSAITVWGIWRQDLRDMHGRQFYVPHMILLNAVHGRWEFSELLDRLDSMHRRHALKSANSAILIENKASGQTLIQEMSRQGLPIIPWTPDGRGDKVARAWSVQPLIQSGRIWMPKEKTFAQQVLAELEAFPNADHDDYVDSMVQAVSWMRSSYQLPEDPDPEDYSTRRSRGLYW